MAGPDGNRRSASSATGWPDYSFTTTPRPTLLVGCHALVPVYRASDEVANAEWLAELEDAADRLDLGTAARSRAADAFLSALPELERSKRATMAASLYVGALVAGEQRTQSEVADAADVSRLAVQQRWKEVLAAAGLEAPDW
jgi:hypothetical protein